MYVETRAGRRKKNQRRTRDEFSNDIFCDIGKHDGPCVKVSGIKSYGRENYSLELIRIYVKAVFRFTRPVIYAL